MKYPVYLALCCPVYGVESGGEYLSGEFRDGVYTNLALGAEAKLGSEWTALSHREIAALDSAATKLMADSSSPSLEELMNAELPVFYVMKPDMSQRVYMTVSQIRSRDSGLHDRLRQQNNGRIMQLWALIPQ